MTPSPLRISPAPPARPVRRPSKQRKAQSPSRCRDWKTEGDGHKLRLSAETGMGVHAPISIFFKKKACI